MGRKKAEKKPKEAPKKADKKEKKGKGAAPPEKKKGGDDDDDDEEEEDLMGDQAWAKTNEADFSSAVDDMFGDLLAMKADFDANTPDELKNAKMSKMVSRLAPTLVHCHRPFALRCFASPAGHHFLPLAVSPV
eukprot:SAG22_NODE_795_length_7149_cov_16.608227_6_plen_133_part_00